MRNYGKWLLLVVALMFFGAFVYAKPQVTIEGGEAANAWVRLYADDGDDANDKWALVSVASDNSLQFQLNGTVKLTIDTSGNLTQTGEASALIGTSLTLTNALSSTIATIWGGETNDAVCRLYADQGDDAADKWSIESETADNDLSFVQDTTEEFKVESDGDAKATGDLYALGGELYMAASDQYWAIRSTTQLVFIANSGATTNVIDVDITN